MIDFSIETPIIDFSVLIIDSFLILLQAVGRPVIPPYWSLGFHIGFPKYQSTDEIRWILDALQTRYIPMVT